MTTLFDTNLEDVISHGNRGHAHPFVDSMITCADGFTVSVIAGGGAYCLPRPTMCFCAFSSALPPIKQLASEVAHDYPGPYDHVEVGFPSMRPEPWDQWQHYADDPERPPTDTVYGYVPVDMVRALVASHGGEVCRGEE